MNRLLELFQLAHLDQSFLNKSQPSPTGSRIEYCASSICIAILLIYFDHGTKVV